MGLFNRKEVNASKMPVNKSLAAPGFTATIERFAEAQKKSEPDILPIFLYVNDNKSGNALCFFSTTFFARSNNNGEFEPGFSMYLNKEYLGGAFEAFKNSEIFKVFSEEKGVVEFPGQPTKKDVFYIKDFGYEAEAASAVIVGLLKEVFHVRQEDITLQIYLFSYKEEQDDSESTADFDALGNKIASAGFHQDLF